MEVNTTIEPNTADSTRIYGDSSSLTSESETSGGAKSKRKREEPRKPKKKEVDSSSDSSHKSSYDRFKTPIVPSKYESDSRRKNIEQKKSSDTRKVINELKEKYKVIEELKKQLKKNSEQFSDQELSMKNQPHTG